MLTKVHDDGLNKDVIEVSLRGLERCTESLSDKLLHF